MCMILSIAYQEVISGMYDRGPKQLEACTYYDIYVGASSDLYPS
jgi:hypothetical protein